MREMGGETHHLGSGVLERLPEGFGFLRAIETSFLSGPDDIYVSPSQIRRFQLRTGDVVSGRIRAPRESERFLALLELRTLNGRDPEQRPRPLLFDNRIPLPPHRYLSLEYDSDAFYSRAVDLLAPMARGQRVMVMAPPGGSHRHLLHQLLLGLGRNHQDLQIFTLLIGKRPEEITALKVDYPGCLLSTVFDEQPARHWQLTDITMEMARRMAEEGKDVAIVLDSLNALGRSIQEGTSPTGQFNPGVVAPPVLHRLRRVLATARVLEGAGSVTLITTLLMETGRAWDRALEASLLGFENARVTLKQGVVRTATEALVDPLNTWSIGMRHYVGADGQTSRATFRSTLPADPARSAAVLWERMASTSENGLLVERQKEQ